MDNILKSALDKIMQQAKEEKEKEVLKKAFPFLYEQPVSAKQGAGETAAANTGMARGSSG